MPIPLHSLSDTWPNDGASYDALRMDVADSNSGANNFLIRLRRNGSDAFSVGSDGFIKTGGHQIGTTAGTVAAGDDARIVGATRFDVAQTLTVTQEARSRANLGFADNYTTAQLIALDPTTSKQLAFAYCTDCINAGSPNGSGGMVRWSDVSQQWVTFDDNCPVTTDLMSYALQIHCTGCSGGMKKGRIVGFYSLPTPNSGVFANQVGSSTDLSTASNLGIASTHGIRIPFRALAGQLSAGRSILRLSGNFPQYQTSGFATSSSGMFGNVALGEERRAMVLVGSLLSFSQSGPTAGTNDYAWRFGICTANADMATTPSTFIGFFYDRSNNAGWAAGTTDTVRGHVRINGTTLLDPTTTASDTLVAPSNTNLAHMLMAIAVEPTGTSGNNARVRIGFLRGRSGTWAMYETTQSFGPSTERFLQSIAAIAVGTRTSAATTAEAVYDQITHCTAFVGGSTGNQPVNPPVTLEVEDFAGAD